MWTRGKGVLVSELPLGQRLSLTGDPWRDHMSHDEARKLGYFPAFALLLTICGIHEAARKSLQAGKRPAVQESAGLQGTSGGAVTSTGGKLQSVSDLGVLGVPCIRHWGPCEMIWCGIESWH